MSARASKHLMDDILARALRHLGLDAVAAPQSYYPDGRESMAIRVAIGRDTVALVTESFDGAKERERTEQAAARLLRQDQPKCVVAVCYTDSFAERSVEDAGFAWRTIRRRQAGSPWMAGGIDDLAFNIALSLADPRIPENAACALMGLICNYIPGSVIRALPISAATNQTLEETRGLLDEVFYVDFIVASQDGSRAGFSENGKNAEVLLVCRPRARGSPQVTRAINLARNPSSDECAQAIASGISNLIQSSDNEVHELASVQSVDPAELLEGDWGVVHFLSPSLRRQFQRLKHGYIFRVATLGTLAEIDQTGSSVRRAFTLEQSLIQDEQEYYGFWGHDSDSARTMRAKAETKIWARPKQAASACRCLRRRSRLLLAGQPYLPSVGTMAVILDEPSLGSMWTNCSIREKYQQTEDYEKALCVYLNSTLGILAMIGSFTRRNDSKRLWPTVKELRDLIVPDFANNYGAVKTLSAVFDRLGSCKLSPLAQADSCPVRTSIDTAVCKALDVNDQVASTIRQHIATEPLLRSGSRTELELPNPKNQQMSFLPYIDLNK